MPEGGLSVCIPTQSSFHSFVMSCCPHSSSASCSNLYDVFCNIADDEREHVKTMKACRDYSIVSDIAQKKLTGQNGKDDMTPDLSVTNGSVKHEGKQL